MHIFNVYIYINIGYDFYFFIFKNIKKMTIRRMVILNEIIFDF